MRTTIKKLILVLLIFNSILGCNNFVLIGPPGAGKGTFSSYMVEKKGYKHICPGDIIRTHIKNNTELGKQIKPGFERGEYVPDEIVFNIVKEQIEKCISKKIPFIIDGFLRKDNGLDFLVNLLKIHKIDNKTKFIHFKVDDETCLNRIMNRVACFHCYRVYNLINNKPKQNLMCDNCSHILEIRMGDTEEIVKRRLLHFHKIIEPMIEVIKKKFEVISFDSNNSIEKCIEFYESLIV